MIKELEYHAAHDLKEALKLAEQFGSRKRFLSGGTDVAVRLKEGLIREDIILDLSHVTELRFVREKSGVVHVGACATHADLSASPIVRQHGCALALAASRVGGPQIRNMGTVGGNVANASPAGDTIPALIVLDAVVSIASRTGTREVPIIDFFTGPGRSVLAADELVTELHFPATGPGELSGFGKLGARQAMTISTANVASTSGSGTTGASWRLASPSARLRRPWSGHTRLSRCSVSFLHSFHGTPFAPLPRWPGRK